MGAEKVPALTGGHLDRVTQTVEQNASTDVWHTIRVWHDSGCAVVVACHRAFSSFRDKVKVICLLIQTRPGQMGALIVRPKKKGPTRPYGRAGETKFYAASFCRETNSIIPPNSTETHSCVMATAISWARDITS